MNEFIKEWGAPGFVIISLAIYFAIRDKVHDKQIEKMNGDHANERKDWRQTTERQFEEMSKNSKDVVNALNTTNNAVNIVRSMLESKK